MFTCWRAGSSERPAGGRPAQNIGASDSSLADVQSARLSSLSSRSYCHQEGENVGNSRLNQHFKESFEKSY